MAIECIKQENCGYFAAGSLALGGASLLALKLLSPPAFNAAKWPISGITVLATGGFALGYLQKSDKVEPPTPKKDDPEKDPEPPKLQWPLVTITRIDEDNVPRLYVQCSAKDQAGAEALQKLFNNTVGGFEFSNPKQEGDHWSTRTLCQLHLQSDPDATAGDRGNSVPHCFARVINIALARFPQTRIAPQVKQLFADEDWVSNGDQMAAWGMSPQLTGLKALAEILNNSELKPAELLAKLRDREKDLRVADDVQQTLVSGAYVPLLDALKNDLDKLS